VSSKATNAAVRVRRLIRTQLEAGFETNSRSSASRASPTAWRHFCTSPSVYALEPERRLSTDVKAGINVIWGMCRERSDRICREAPENKCPKTSHSRVILQVVQWAAVQDLGMIQWFPPLVYMWIWRAMPVPRFAAENLLCAKREGRPLDKDTRRQRQWEGSRSSLRPDRAKPPVRWY
jgi:hypothetical protein